MEEKNKIELRSEEINDILARPPHALVRYGTVLICSILLLMFAGSFFFRYPDIIQGNVVVTTENPPVWLIARVDGGIKSLLVADNQKVLKGDLLAVIDNPAETDDILRIRDLLKLSVVSDSLMFFPESGLNFEPKLGDIQDAYTQFMTALEDFNQFKKLNLIEKEKMMLGNQIKNRKTYVSNLENQLFIKKKELKISTSELNRDRELYQQKVISAFDLEQAEQKYLSKQQELHQIESGITLERLQLNVYHDEISKLKTQNEKEKNQRITHLKNAFNELESRLEQWSLNYLLVSPQNGVVTFNTVWKQNQFVEAGQKVMAVVPQKQGKLIGKIKLPFEGSGKVKINQKVNIKIDGYPYLEYGFLQGNISNISRVPDEKFYMAEMQLPQQLLSSTGKKLSFTGELQGTAEIITENRSLIARIFGPLRYLFQKYGSVN